jgi:hypothetical protein
MSNVGSARQRSSSGYTYEQNTCPSGLLSVNKVFAMAYVNFQKPVSGFRKWYNEINFGSYFMQHMQQGQFIKLKNCIQFCFYHPY